MEGQPANEGVDTSDEVWEQLTAPIAVTYAQRAASLKQLVHYTNFSTLKGIVERQELWFSPIAGMNDWDEVKRGKRLLENISSKDSPLRGCFDRIRSWNEDVWRKLDAAYKSRIEVDFFDTFVSCWSECDLQAESHDNLAMWRGYAADGNGVAIVIDPMSFKMGTSSSDVVACPVFYETESQFQERACLAFNAYADALIALDPATREQNSFHVEAAFAELCFYLAVTHKHPGFALEKEWRFVWRRYLDFDGAMTPRVRAEVTKRGMFEYFCLPIDDLHKLTPASPKLSEIIVGVMVGPTDDVLLKLSAVKTLLRKAGFDASRTVTTISEIPYRSFS